MSYTTSDLKRWAFTDELTGLANRRRIRLAVRECRARAHFVAIDLDGFKRAQDRPGRGHLWGDRVLKRFAMDLRGMVRNSDLRSRDVVLGRPGGDEFCVRVPNVRAAERVAARVAVWEFAGVRASCGIGRSLRSADRALYAVKRANKRQRV